MDEISLHILDIIQNSIRAGAKLIIISISINEKNGFITVCVEDDGCGMDEAYVKKVCNPFVTERKTRKVGLGLPLLKAGAEATGGSFEIESRKGVGTKVLACFNYKSIDCPPVGKMSETFASQVSCNPDIDFVYKISNSNGAEMCVDTREVRAVLGPEVPLNSPEVAEWLLEASREQEKEVCDQSDILFM